MRCDLPATKSDLLSGTNLQPGGWDISRDLTPWKEARAQLVKLATELGAATEILSRDRVVFDALLHASMNLPFRELSDLVTAAFEFEQVAREAASIEEKRQSAVSAVGA